MTRKSLTCIIGRLSAVLVAGLLALLLAGCGGGDDSSTPAEEPAADPAPMAFGALGGVEIAAGDAIQIRSLLAHDGWEVAA